MYRNNQIPDVKFDSSMTTSLASSGTDIPVDVISIERLRDFNTKGMLQLAGPIKPYPVKGDIISVIVSATESSIFSKSSSETHLIISPE